MNRGVYLCFTLLYLVTAVAQDSVSRREGRFACMAKLSPMLADLAADSPQAESRYAGRCSTADSGEDCVLALVKLSAGATDEVLARQGCKVVDRTGDIVIAILPVSRLRELAADEGVVRMEANPLSRPMLDITPGAVSAEAAWQGLRLPQAFTGKGVVVGVADIGFDYSHPMFSDSLGRTRIRQAWDIYTGGTDGYKTIGTLYTTPEQLALAGGTGDSTQYHGTHVAAIAAGGRVGKYRGLALEADIVLSQAHLTGYSQQQYQRLLHSLNASLHNDTYDPLVAEVAYKRLTLSSAMEVLAVKHAMDYASAHGQPCVVNCSFGGQMKLTDDYTLQQELMNSLTGPGRIVVCAAGNYGDGILYKVKPERGRMDERLWFKSSLKPVITLRSKGDFTVKLLIDINGADTLRLSSAAIREAAMRGESRADSVRIEGASHDSWFRTRSQAYDSSGGQVSYAVTLQLPDTAHHYRSPSMAFVIEGGAEVEVMGASSAATFNALSEGSYAANAPYTVCQPGAFSQMIAVGLTSHRDSVTNQWGERVTYEYNNNPLGRVVSWSAAGPTLDGLLKPDVVAPGHNIVSAFNSHLSVDSISTKKQRMVVGCDSLHGRQYPWLSESGSSMSAPVVTGVIALWLQADPKLTPDGVRQLLAATARHPEQDDDYPNCRYGYGEIDAYRGLLHLTGMDGIAALSTHQPQRLELCLHGRCLHLGGALQATVTAYSLGGRMAAVIPTTDGTADLSPLHPGVYALQIETDDPSTTGSTLVRIK